MKKTAIILTAILGFSQIAYAADDLQMGVDAFNKKNYAQALKILQPLAEAGNAEAQFTLGAMYGQGTGVERDRAKSLELITKSADQGNLDALERMVMAYAFKPGADDAEVDAIFARALKTYQEEADKGNAKAMNKIAGMHAMGFSFEQSDTEALVWYKKAAELGDATAQFKIGYYFYSGIGGDKKESKAWFEKAAAQGNTEAKEYLDEIAYSEGLNKK
jgi:TPR repeat protein